MSHERVFSFTRWWGIVLKEFLQLKRDRLTFGMIVGLPVVQLLLFGYAINNDPKHMPLHWFWASKASSPGASRPLYAIHNIFPSLAL